MSALGDPHNRRTIGKADTHLPGDNHVLDGAKLPQASRGTDFPVQFDKVFFVKIFSLNCLENKRGFLHGSPAKTNKSGKKVAKRNG